LLRIIVDQQLHPKWTTLTSLQEEWRKSQHHSYYSKRRHKLYIGEISPTRCDNCVFYSQWLYSTCFGWQSHPSSGVQCSIWPQVSWLT
jgi:hypothetical protein